MTSIWGNSATSRETRIQAVAMPAGHTTVTRTLGRRRWRSSEPARYIVSRPTSSTGISASATGPTCGEDLGGGPVDVRIALADLLLEGIADREPEPQSDVEPADVLEEARPELLVVGEGRVDPVGRGGDDPVDVADVDRLRPGRDVDELGQPEQGFGDRGDIRPPERDADGAPRPPARSGPRSPRTG